MPRANDMTGVTVNNILFLRDAGKVSCNRSRVWICECLICGVEFERSVQDNNNPDFGTKGCGDHISVNMTVAHENATPLDRLEALDGRTYEEVAAELGIQVKSLKRRLRRGWDPEKAMETPRQ